MIYLVEERFSYDNQQNEEYQDCCHIIANTTVTYSTDFAHPTLLLDLEYFISYV